MPRFFQMPGKPELAIRGGLFQHESLGEFPGPGFCRSRKSQPGQPGNLLDREIPESFDHYASIFGCALEAFAYLPVGKTKGDQFLLTIPGPGTAEIDREDHPGAILDYVGIVEVEPNPQGLLLSPGLGRAQHHRYPGPLQVGNGLNSRTRFVSVVGDQRPIDIGHQ